MSPTPLISIRAALEHHALVRQIAARLRHDPGAADRLAYALEAERGPEADGDVMARYNVTFGGGYDRRTRWRAAS